MGNFEWIKLIFLLQSITSNTAAIDQYVTFALKAKYCSSVVLKLIQFWKKKRQYNSSPLSLLWSVEKGLVCYFKQRLSSTDILDEAEKRTFFDEDDFFAGMGNIQELVNNLEYNLIFFKENFCEQVENNITLDKYMDLNIGINTMHGQLSNQNILAEVNNA